MLVMEKLNLEFDNEMTPRINDKKRATKKVNTCNSAICV